MVLTAGLVLNSAIVASVNVRVTGSDRARSFGTAWNLWLLSQGLAE